MSTAVEDEEPRRPATTEELADFAEWGKGFLAFLEKSPTAEEGEPRECS